MHISLTYQKEFITVLHNNAEEMRKNVAQLKEEGWSDNIRGSITHSLDENERTSIQKIVPGITIHEPEQNHFFHSTHPYVYATEHERKINEA